MARIGNQLAKLSGSYSTSYIGTWQLASQNVLTNQSTFNLRGYFYYGGGTTVTSSYSTFKLNNKTIKTGSYSYGPGDHLLDTISLVITHNSDGSFPGKNVALYANSSHISGSTNGKISSSSVATIPRTSTVTATDAYIGSATSINIARASASFTHKLLYSIDEGVNFNDIVSNVETSYGWMIPTFFYTLIPNAKSLNCIIRCETYNEETLIGTSETTFRASVNEEINKPEVSAVVKDINEKSLNLTGDESKIVKYVSNVQVSLSTLAKNGASIVSKSISCGDGKTLNEDGIILAVESSKFVVSTIDSRGIHNSTEVSGLSLIDYIKLTLNANFYRVQPTTGEMAVTFNGNYFNNTFGKVTNSLSLKYRYKIRGTDNWSNYINLVPVISGNTFSNGENPILLGNNFDYQQSYDFELLAEDAASEQLFTQTRGVGIPTYNWGKNNFNHNTVVYQKSGNEILDYDLYEKADGSNYIKFINSAGIVQEVINKVSLILSTSSDEEIPSAKAVSNFVQQYLEEMLKRVDITINGLPSGSTYKAFYFPKLSMCFCAIYLTGKSFATGERHTIGTVASEYRPARRTALAMDGLQDYAEVLKASITSTGEISFTTSADKVSSDDMYISGCWCLE